jgi:aryl-alcohol dehydrogenase-like predicted oxidoreductase
VVSVAGLGCNNFGGRLDLDGTRAVVDAAIDAGITLFDTSDTYGEGGGSERALGEILGRRRDQIVLATKFGHQRADMGYGPAAGAKGGRAYIRRAVTESLRRLRTDYIDLYQLHTPDPVTPVEETIAALNELVAEGKVRYLGHSNFSGWQLADASHLATIGGHAPFISAQNHWSLLERAAEAELVPAARHFGVGVLPYFPLANGLLTGKVDPERIFPEDDLRHNNPMFSRESRLRVREMFEHLAPVTRKYNFTDGQLASAWALAQPGITHALVGARDERQAAENAWAGGVLLAAADVMRVTEAEQVDALVEA